MLILLKSKKIMRQIMIWRKIVWLGMRYNLEKIVVITQNTF